MIIGFIIWSMVSVLFLVIGMSCRRSDKAVGFFTFVKPPIVNDIKAYNKAVSVLWIVSAAVFEIIGIPFLFIKQNSPIFVLIILAVVLWSILLAVIYLKIEAKYKK